MESKIPQISLIYNRRKIASPTRKAAVEVRVTHNYKQKYISTGIMLYPSQWKKSKITNCTNLVQISQTLDKIVTDIRQVIFEMMQDGNVDINAIPERLSKKKQERISFIDFCIQRANVRKYGKSKDNKRRYDRFIKYFNEYGKIVTFEDITEQNIIEYDKYLERKGLKENSKWSCYHRFLNSFISDAINDGYLHKNPYKWIHINKGRYKDALERCLTPEEFRKIKNACMPTPSLEKVRDVFVFQTYTCLSYTDLRSFNISRIKEIKGMKVYTGSRQKTMKTYTIPILAPAWDILMKYNGKLPIISNVKYNLYLKNVAQAAGIEKHISTHWARHTGATLLLNEGVDLNIVSKICGHSSIKITEQIYAKLLDETIVDAVDSVKDKL